MPARPTIAAIRFGTGLSPRHPAPSEADLLADLQGPDRIAADLPRMGFDDELEKVRAYRFERKAQRDAGTTDRDRLRALQAPIFEATATGLTTRLARGIASPTGLRERLLSFWADHFTVRSKTNTDFALVGAYAEEAIRPYMLGRFSDLLKSAVTHPMMLIYLDQFQSVGPNSRVGQRRGRGLNENLAREVIELHTLGVGAGYTQNDVRGLAKLLTGLSFDIRRGFIYRQAIAEPGRSTVLGKAYGRPQIADISRVHAVLDDLATHPATAAHIARKLAVHFTSDTPDQALVAHLADRFRQTGGDLAAVTAALIEHPAAWQGFGAKARQPFDFVQAALRALDVPIKPLTELELRRVRSLLTQPLDRMGQPYERPNGPDGWAEDLNAWITPQGLAGRITWAMALPQEATDDLPDPRNFVQTALGDAARPATLFAAKAAETRWEGVGLILSAPEFHRR